MSLQHYFRRDDNVVEEITDHVRLYEYETTMQAEEGSHGSSMVPVDDPNAELTIGGHRLFYSMESSATGSNAVTYVGYTADRDVHRGPYKNDVGRVWDVNLVDINSVLSRRILTASSANRPAETDVARMQWLFGTEEADIIDNVTDLFDATGGVAMDAVDYRGQTVEDVANDCANASGKNYAVINQGTFAGNFYLVYMFADSELFSSPVRLSNYLPDLDDPLTFAISEDTKLNRDPSRVYSGVYLPYDGGTNAAVYEQSVATANTFALKGRDVQMDGRNIKTQAKATARALRYLTELDIEEDRITTSFQVPAAQVNFLWPWMRVQFRATHLPGYEDFVWLRVLKRTVKQDSELTYWVTVELSTGPSAPATVPVEATYEAELVIGSGSFIGEGSDRNQAWASDQPGVTLPTLEVGKEYRLRAEVIETLSIPIECSPGVTRDYDHMEEPKIMLTEPGAVGSINETGGFTWVPGDGALRTEGHFDAVSFFYDGDWDCGDPPYYPGATFVGDWLRFDGPPVQADLSIQGQPISGFYGFYWKVNVRLESRDA
jgi:hypothetical protein